MGSGISSMTPSRGYCVEWVASLVGLIFTATGTKTRVYIDYRVKIISFSYIIFDTYNHN